MSELLIKGAAAIAREIGENRNTIPKLVEEEGLPAWRRDGQGPWKALPEDLTKWLREQRTKHIPKTRQ